MACSSLSFGTLEGTAHPPTNKIRANFTFHVPVLLLQAVPYSFSIATVKRYIWKRSDDVIFHYRILDPARLAPFPQLGMDS
jgi:hypothetical protein